MLNEFKTAYTGLVGSLLVLGLIVFAHVTSGLCLNMLGFVVSIARMMTSDVF